MSEKTTISERPPGLPFGNNCDDVSAQIRRSAHDAQWQRFLATGNTLVGSPLPLIHSGAVALKGESAMVMNATIIKAEGATIIRVERPATVSPVLGQPDLAVHSKDVQAPNRLLESLFVTARVPTRVGTLWRYK